MYNYGQKTPEEEVLDEIIKLIKNSSLGKKVSNWNERREQRNKKWEPIQTAPESLPTKSPEELYNDWANSINEINANGPQDIKQKADLLARSFLKMEDDIYIFEYTDEQEKTTASLIDDILKNDDALKQEVKKSFNALKEQRSDFLKSFEVLNELHLNSTDKKKLQELKNNLEDIPAHGTETRSFDVIAFNKLKKSLIDEYEKWTPPRESKNPFSNRKTKTWDEFINHLANSPNENKYAQVVAVALQGFLEAGHKDDNNQIAQLKDLNFLRLQDTKEEKILSQQQKSIMKFVEKVKSYVTGNPTPQVLNEAQREQLEKRNKFRTSSDNAHTKIQTFLGERSKQAKDELVLGRYLRVQENEVKAKEAEDQRKATIEQSGAERARRGAKAPPPDQTYKSPEQAVVQNFNDTSTPSEENTSQKRRVLQRTEPSKDLQMRQDESAKAKLNDSKGENMSSKHGVLRRTEHSNDLQKEQESEPSHTPRMGR